ncbi:MAG: beta-galactosidase trimerization domain-containing protein [Kiritimatiellae bacterium]|nr:beta-galactosidase trimerization domain-containing protein [Kiritimatiellia bacterium]
MHIPKWALFFDFHTVPTNPDVGKAFDMAAITDWVAECGADFIVFPARCNLGMAYYPTQLGVPHPAMKRDLFGELAAACQSKGIALSAYINVGLSHEEAYRHRDWAILHADGRTYREPFGHHFFRQMCYNSGYGDHVAAMAREIAERYPVAGFFFDCFHTPPCIGVECMDRMTAEGVDWQDPEALNDFNLRKVHAMGRKLSDAVREIRPDLLIYFNGVDFEGQAEFGTYLELECLPQGGWGYEVLPMVSRYMRTLGKPVLNMTGRFQKSWGDFGGVRPVPSVEYDCIRGIANAVPPSIGDHFHPRGDLNRAVMELDKAVYDRLRPLQPWIDEAKPVVEMATVMKCGYPGQAWAGGERPHRKQLAVEATKAATRMLCELKMQFDNVSLASDWDAYKLLVLPDEVEIGPELAERLQAHVARGGGILATGWSGLDPERQRFVLDAWGVEYKGDDPLDPAYVEFAPGFSEGMPDMPVTLYEQGIRLAAGPGAEVLATITAPYCSLGWDGRHGFYYTPPDKTTGRPAVTLNGRVAHVSHPIFRTYYRSGALPLRQIVANLLDRLLPEPLVRAPGAPSFSRVTVTEQPGRRMVYVLAYLPEARGAGVQMIEEPIELNDFTLSLRIDGRTPRNVYLAPSGTKLDFRIEGNYATTCIPRVAGWAVVVLEE